MGGGVQFCLDVHTASPDPRCGIAATVASLDSSTLPSGCEVSITVRLPEAPSQDTDTGVCESRIGGDKGKSDRIGLKNGVIGVIPAQKRGSRRKPQLRCCGCGRSSRIRDRIVSTHGVKGEGAVSTGCANTDRINRGVLPSVCDRSKSNSPKASQQSAMLMST